MLEQIVCRLEEKTKDYHEINKKQKFYYSSSNDDSKWRLFSKAITGRTITSIEEIVFFKLQRGGK
jgi:hypothetical protein